MDQELSAVIPKDTAPHCPSFSNASCLCRALRDFLDVCCSVAKSSPSALRGSGDWGEDAAEEKVF